MTNNKDGDSDGDNDDDDEDNDDDDDDNNDDVYKDDYYDKYCFSYMPVSFYASCFKLASVTFDVSRTSRHIPPCEFKLYHLAILHRRNYSLDLHSDIHWSHQLFSHPKQDILATRASYDVHPSKRTDQTR